MDLLTELLRQLLGSKSRSKIAILITIFILVIIFLVGYERYTASLRLNRLQKEADLIARIQEVQVQGTNLMTPELLRLRTVLLANATKTITEERISLEFVPSKLTFSFDSMWRFLAGAFLWSLFAIYFLAKRKTADYRKTFSGYMVLALISGIAGLFVPTVWWPWFHIFIFPWLLIIGITICLLPFVIVIANYQSAKNKAYTNACINNLRQIDAAKNQWALENLKTQDNMPTEEDLMPYLAGSSFPKCPSGGTYKLNSVKAVPICSEKGHHLSH